MVERPYWSGQIRISLVTFAVTLKSAIKRGSQAPLHEYERKSGQRIHHKNIVQDGRAVSDEDIVKGFDTEHKPIFVEKDEIEKIKLPSSDTLDLDVFTPLSSIPFYRFERPYFVLPGAKDAKDIYSVIHRALLESNVAGIGQITLRGREELCAVLPVAKGMMLQTLRYNSELESEASVFPAEEVSKAKSDYLDLANQLVRKNTHDPDFSKFHDRYHEALLSLIDAKKSRKKAPVFKTAKPTAHIVDFADALRKSLGKSIPKKTPSRRAG